MKRIPLKQAQREVFILMRYFVSGCDRENKAQLLKSYDRIIIAIWQQWNVGIYQLQAKHVQWYFDVVPEANKWSPATRYRYWRRFRELLTVVGKFNDWEPLLRGPWINPKGEPFSGSNRGRKPKHIKKNP